MPRRDTVRILMVGDGESGVWVPIGSSTWSSRVKSDVPVLNRLPLATVIIGITITVCRWGGQEHDHNKLDQGEFRTTCESTFRVGPLGHTAALKGTLLILILLQSERFNSFPTRRASVIAAVQRNPNRIRYVTYHACSNGSVDENRSNTSYQR